MPTMYKGDAVASVDFEQITAMKAGGWSTEKEAVTEPEPEKEEEGADATPEPEGEVKDSAEAPVDSVAEPAPKPARRRAR